MVASMEAVPLDEHRLQIRFDMVKARCGSCRYSLPNGDSLHCRRFPPSLVTDNEQVTTYGYPLVSPVLVACGEYRPAWLKLLKLVK